MSMIATSHSNYCSS